MNPDPTNIQIRCLGDGMAVDYLQFPLPVALWG